MKTPRSGRWYGYDRGQHARTNQESAHQAERKGQDGEQNVVQLFKASRFSATLAEWSKAVAASQGMKLAFSTGSQNHQPPQPSS